MSSMQLADLFIAAFHAKQFDQRALRDALAEPVISLDPFYRLVAGLANTISETNAYCKDHNISIITCLDEGYPPLLRQIPDFPFVLYAKGHIDLLKQSTIIGVVGTRKSSDYYKEMAYNLGNQLSHYNIVTASGLAEGIDTAAHLGALESGQTIAVLGHGIDIVFPVSNRALFKEVEEKGLLLTEFPPHYPGSRWTFPLRNRIIAGLSRGIVVVESAVSGGSLITAEQALSYDREVFAFPGRPTDSNCMGTNKLIQSGAKLVLSIQDILDELNWLIPPSQAKHVGPTYSLSSDEQRVFDVLTSEAMSIDQLLGLTRLSTQVLMTILSFLQLQGIVREIPGKLFRRI